MKNVTYHVILVFFLGVGGVYFEGLGIYKSSLGFSTEGTVFGKPFGNATCQWQGSTIVQETC